MHIQLGTEKIEVELLPSPNGGMDMRFAESRPVLQLRTPGGRLDDQAEIFLRQKSRWILKHYLRVKAWEKSRESFIGNLGDGKLLWMGKPLKIHFFRGNKTLVEFGEEALTVRYRPRPEGINWYLLMQAALRAYAKPILQQRCYKIADRIGLIPAAVRVKHLRSKWGSCSDLSNVNLNWQLCLLSEPLIDYVIIHELAHLRELNHSRKFWAIVGRHFPDFQEARAELKEENWVIGVLDYAASLHPENVLL